METMKRKWGKPVTEVQQFQVNECIASCSLPEESKLYFALSQEFNGIEGRQDAEQRTFNHYYYLLDPAPTEGGTFTHGYFTWPVNDVKFFYSTDEIHFEETTNPYIAWASGRHDFVALENIFYRENKFQYLTITDETKNLS